MSEDEKTIRTQIERWAQGVHRGDLDAVLADRSTDIVMFDVPPPHDGVRGIDAYRATWPPFFAWQAAGALFEVVAVEVTAGVDTAFAHALLRCGMPDELAANPGNRLRITFGLRREGERWLVTHEHHSFPDASLPDASDADTDTDTDAATDAVRALHRRWFAATAAKDLDGIMDGIADDVVSYEHEAPLVHEGAGAVREVCRGGLEASTDSVTWDVPDLEVVVDGDLAVGWGLNRVIADGRAWWSRGTRVFRRRAGRWEMTHQHVSYPYDPATGAALTDLRP